MSEVDNIRKKLEDTINLVKGEALRILRTEVKKSIDLNFETEGRGKWKKKNKKDGRKTLQGKTGKLMQVSVIIDEAGSKIVAMPNPLAGAYARIHQEGGTINMPARTVRTGKNKRGRTVFVKSSRKRGVKETQGKSYIIKIPARPYLVVPEEDFGRILNALGKIKV